MTTFGHHLDRARRRLYTAGGSVALECRASDGTTWTALDDGAIFHRDGSTVAWDPSLHGEAQMETGHLIVAEAQAELPDGTQIRVGGESGSHWAIVGGPSGAGGSRYQLKRTKLADGDAAASNRGRR